MGRKENRIMKIKDFEGIAKLELEEEDQTMVTEKVKERLREIRSAEIVLAKLKKKYTEFLESDTDELLI